MRARRPVVRNRPKIGHQDPEAPVWQVPSQFAMATAEQTGRRARGIEIDPGYVDVAIKRWQRFTGKSALLAGTDQTFKEIEGQRAHSGPPEAKADQVVMPADREAA